ncbi:nickel pincer cofactor biosynthesis protein LarB [Pleomorphomonas carboxyditropha]|uniref:Circadian phase modifier CpmA n=1 Tax=Pleomorphomonas carboxyditropha TaxID=2023338 RepID=A0A2G9WXK5_9HYPH|nr:nickel pincer cofactor biosynthesis protein LarB [Pleomorphomonas carboxyditropha]PIO98860.1 circadian phase modifier CpmA [Pleomorphomonas carboxyditropha]
MSDDFLIDWDRERRTGVTEAIFCAGKSTLQLTAILRSAGEQRLLLTRLSATALEALPADLAARLDFDPLSHTAVLGPAVVVAPARVCIVAAGTSDLPVAREAERTLAFHGEGAHLIGDVGVAGLWRLMSEIEAIRRHAVVVAVAGMEGALFSVLAGLVDAPVIAVPTSVGYGVAEGGRAALSSALASCAPGLATVNIDNGFGAACLALRMLRLAPRHA